MAHAEEQAEELEVLSSIYQDELSVVGADPYKFKFALKPTASPDNCHVSIFLICELSCDYPDVIPTISAEPVKGLGKKQLDEITNLALRLANENIGMPCIFVIVEAVKEWLGDNNVAGQDGSMYADMVRRMQQKDVEQKKKVEKEAISAAADMEIKNDNKPQVDLEEEERIRKRQAGVAVTLENFEMWKKKFDAEMDSIKLAARAANPHAHEEVDMTKLSGKQIFMSNSAVCAMEDALIAASEAELEAEEAQGQAQAQGGDSLLSHSRSNGEDDEDDEEDEDYDDEEDDHDEDDRDSDLEDSTAAVHHC